MITFRLLDGVQAFDDWVLKTGATPYNIPSEYWPRWDALSVSLFGVTYGDTFYARADEVEELSEIAPEYARLSAEWDAHDAQFIDETEGNPAVLEHLKKLGIDFSPSVGRYMPSMLFFARQAEAAAKGILGARLPSSANMTEHFANKLKADAESFRRRRREQR